MIHRSIEDNIRKALDGKKAVTIMGARQVGKSTLTEALFSGEENVLFLDGDEADVRAILKDATSTRLRAIFGKATTVVIDEAQKIDDIGNVLKLVTDKMKDIRLVATGSSAFELAEEVNESLSGRKREFKLFPLSFKELVDDSSLLEQTRLLPQRLLYGNYPEVVTSPGEERIVLKELMDSYLYKDVLNIKGIAKQDFVLWHSRLVPRSVTTRLQISSASTPRLSRSISTSWRNATLSSVSHPLPATFAMSSNSTRRSIFGTWVSATPSSGTLHPLNFGTIGK